MGCFQFLAVINTVAINILDTSSCGHVSCSSPALLPPPTSGLSTQILEAFYQLMLSLENIGYHIDYLPALL